MTTASSQPAAKRLRPVDALLIGLPSLICGLSAIGGIALAVFGPDQVALAVLGFEIVTLASSIVGVLLGLSFLGRDVAAGALSIAGAVIVGSVFASISVQHSIAGVELKPLLAGRALLGLMMLLGAVHAAIGTHPTAWKRLVGGIAFAGPVVAGLGFVLFGPARGLTSQVSSLPPAALWALGMLGFVLISIVFSVGVHLIIRAFDPDLTRARPAGAKPGAAESE